MKIWSGPPYQSVRSVGQNFALDRHRAKISVYNCFSYWALVKHRVNGIHFALFQGRKEIDVMDTVWIISGAVLLIEAVRRLFLGGRF